MQQSAGNRGRITDILVERGYCTRERIEELRRTAKEYNNVNYLDILTNDIEDGSDKELLAQCLAEAYSAPYIKANDNITIDAAVADVIGIAAMEKSKVVGIKYNGISYLLVSNPSLKEINVFREKVKAALPLCIASQKTINKLIKSDMRRIASSLTAKKIGSEEMFNTDAISELDTQISDSAIAEYYNDIIRYAIEQRVSDIHFMSIGGGEAAVKFRVDGKIRHHENVKLVLVDRLYHYLKGKAKISEDTSGETKRPKSAKIRTKYEGREVDLRINIIHTENDTYDINLRILDNEVLDIEQLGFKDSVREAISRLFAMTKGIVLVVGGTGSGKSTTLYAGIKQADYQTRNFCTVEDPVEQSFPGITQVSVEEEKGATFASILKAFLRHDPDVIVVGEIRDLEVAKIALEASNTGHLIFSTLHTNDAISAITRFINMGISPSAVANSLAAVIAQRLVRRVCPNCKEEYELPQGHKWRSQFNLGEDTKIMLARGKGCSKCGQTGYYGRIVINEYVQTSAKLREAIEKGETQNALFNIAKENNYSPMLEDGKEKALAGITTFEELESLVNDLV